MKFHPNLEQGSIEWLKLHTGKVTASGLDNLVTPLFKIRDGEMFRSYVYRKVAEAIHGPLLAFGSWVTEQGKELEDEACAFAALEYGYRVEKMGFCETDDGRAGCSPDALIGDDGGLEIKCPQPPNHVRWLCEGILPKEYAAQVHCSMYVTGRPEWVFLSYARKFPPFYLVVKRDEAICAKIGEAVTAFAEAYDAALAKIRSGL